MIAVPQAAIDLAKRFEGFCRVPKADPERAYPYVCPAGYPTIGYGHICDPLHPPITLAEGEAYLAADMAEALRATLRYCPVLALEPEGGWQPSLTLRLTWGQGGCRHRRCGGGLTSGIGPAQRKNYSAGSTGVAKCCPGSSHVGVPRLHCYFATPDTNARMRLNGCTSRASTSPTM